MPYTYTLTSIIPATPQQVYEAWLDSVAHSEMTGGEATMSDEVGAEVSAWDGYITGSNLELVPGERIVQSWRTSEFDEEHADSIVTVMLEPVEEGTLLTLVHSNVPEAHRSYEEGGWESQYFEPMKVYFARLEQEEAAAEPEETIVARSGPETDIAPAAPRRAKKPAAKRPAAKEAAPKAKAPSAKKKKSKRAAPAKSKRRTARPAKKKVKKAAPKRGAKKKSAAKRSASKRKARGRKRARR